MSSVQPGELPTSALLARYAEGGGYTDCYFTDVPGVVAHDAYVTAFYTTWLFKTERFILKWAVARPSTDEGARRLAAGAADDFAAWRVEARADNQLLMCDFMGRTRSWLMTEKLETAKGAVTRLYFGSAVVPAKTSADGKPEMGFPFSTLLGFHKLYSRALLAAARARLG